MLTFSRYQGLVFAFVFASLVGCGNGEQAEIEQAKEIVIKNLIDPSSAKFGQIKVFRSGVVCGEVNAKNRLGGFTGTKIFMVNQGEIELPASSFNVGYYCTDSDFEMIDMAKESIRDCVNPNDSSRDLCGSLEFGIEQLVQSCSDKFNIDCSKL